MDFADFALSAPIFADSRGFGLSCAILQDFEPILGFVLGYPLGILDGSVRISYS